MLEPKLVYRTARGSVPEGEHVVELGRARMARTGTDVTLVAWGAMVPLCERVADDLAGEASIEVLDLRSLKPLDERAILDLHGPVLRVTGFDVPYPYWQLEDWYMPSADRVSDAVRRVLAF